MSAFEVVDNPAMIVALTQGAEFDKAGIRDLKYIPELGFLALQGRTEEDSLELVGFYAPRTEEYIPERITPTVKLSEVPEPWRTVDIQGKGVGPRLYNTLPSLSGLSDVPEKAGLYSVSLADPEKLLDLRSSEDETMAGKLKRIATHAGRMVRAKTKSLAAVVDEVHASYGDADMVVIGQPPHHTLRQAKRHVKDVPNVKPAFALVRNADLELTRVGFASSRR